jgi:hypothetical protein
MVRKQVDLRAVGPLSVAVFILSIIYALAFGFLGLVFLKSFLWVGWFSFLTTPFLNAIVAGAAAVAWELGGDR